MSLLIPFAFKADPWVNYDAWKAHESTGISPV